MIKLTTEPRPDELTEDIIKNLTEKYKQDKKAVWQQSYIKMALLKMSNGKCCYCECEVNVAGSDLQVEHFYPKHIYEDLVLVWSNLLPACARCNRNKGQLDTKKHPIVNPVTNHPKNHLEVKNYYFFSKNDDDLGEFTIERLRLNDDERLSVARFQLGQEITAQLNELAKDLKVKLTINSSLNIKDETNFTRKLRKIMLYGTATKKYSAVIGSVILNDKNYGYLKQSFINCNLWSDEFIELERQVQFCALDT